MHPVNSGFAALSHRSLCSRPLRARFHLLGAMYFREPIQYLTLLSLFRDCKVYGLGCREDRCDGWRTLLFVRCSANWRALGYRALVSPSLFIRDRCPKPNTCRATALSGVTLTKNDKLVFQTFWFGICLLQ